MKFVKKAVRNEDGQALVEFALVLPILLLLIVAVIDFGWIFMAKIRVTNAARETARYYAVHKDTGTSESTVEVTLKSIAKENLGFVSDANLTVDASYPPNEKVSVSIQALVPPLTRLFFSTDVNIQSVAYMKVEYD